MKFPASAARAKEPRVFLDDDRQALDDAYDQAVYAPKRIQVNVRLAQASELARRRVGAPLRLAYGPAAIEKLDIYRAQGAGAPVILLCGYSGRAVLEQAGLAEAQA